MNERAWPCNTGTVQHYKYVQTVNNNEINLTFIYETMQCTSLGKLKLKLWNALENNRKER